MQLRKHNFVEEEAKESFSSEGEEESEEEDSFVVPDDEIEEELSSSDCEEQFADDLDQFLEKDEKDLRKLERPKEILVDLTQDSPEKEIKRRNGKKKGKKALEMEARLMEQRLEATKKAFFILSKRYNWLANKEMIKQIRYCDSDVEELDLTDSNAQPDFEIPPFENNPTEPSPILSKVEDPEFQEDGANLILQKDEEEPVPCEDPAWPQEEMIPAKLEDIDSKAESPIESEEDAPIPPHSGDEESKEEMPILAEWEDEKPIPAQEFDEDLSLLFPSEDESNEGNSIPGNNQLEDRSEDAKLEEEIPVSEETEWKEITNLVPSDPTLEETTVSIDIEQAQDELIPFQLDNPGSNEDAVPRIEPTGRNIQSDINSAESIENVTMESLEDDPLLEDTMNLRTSEELTNHEDDRIFASQNPIQSEDSPTKDSLEGEESLDRRDSVLSQDFTDVLAAMDEDLEIAFAGLDGVLGEDPANGTETKNLTPEASSSGLNSVRRSLEPVSCSLEDQMEFVARKLSMEASSEDDEEIQSNSEDIQTQEDIRLSEEENGSRDNFVQESVDGDFSDDEEEKLLILSQLGDILGPGNSNAASPLQDDLNPASPLQDDLKGTENIEKGLEDTADIDDSPLELSDSQQEPEKDSEEESEKDSEESEKDSEESAEDDPEDDREDNESAIEAEFEFAEEKPRKSSLLHFKKKKGIQLRFY